MWKSDVHCVPKVIADTPRVLVMLMAVRAAFPLGGGRLTVPLDWIHRLVRNLYCLMLIFFLF